MSLRLPCLIRVIALCEFIRPFCAIKRVLSSITGAEMVIHTAIFGLTAAAMLVGKAGGKCRPAVLVRESADVPRISL